MLDRARPAAGRHNDRWRGRDDGTGGREREFNGKAVGVISRSHIVYVKGFSNIREQLGI